MRDQQANLNYRQGNLIQDIRKLPIKTCLRVLLLKKHSKNYTLFIAANKDFKKSKTNRPELDDYR